MVLWLRKTNEYLAEIPIKLTMYFCQVDGINIVTKVFLKDNNDVLEANTTYSIQQIATSIHQSIEITIGYTIKHHKCRLPSF